MRIVVQKIPLRRLATAAFTSVAVSHVRHSVLTLLLTASAALLATGASDHIWVETATGRPCRTPEAVREPFRRLAGLE